MKYKKILFISFGILLLLLPFLYISFQGELKNSETLFTSFTLSTGESFNVTVGREIKILGPEANNIDGNTIFEKINSDTYRAFTSNGDTYSYTTKNFLKFKKEGTALKKGSANNFDECGAWLMSIYKLNKNKWIGWYHAEEKCNYEAGITKKSIAYVESTDEGQTWKKLNYPNNQVLTAESRYENNVSKDDAGDGKVIKVGDYFYMLYRATVDWKVHIARSKVSSGGKPGTWYKYYCKQSNVCDFTEPGIGGKSTALEGGTTPHISFSSYLNSYIGIDTYGRWGFNLRISNGDNILKWNSYSPVIYPEVSYADDLRVDNWGSKSKDDLSLYAYPSIVGIDGNEKDVGKSFYLYYTKLFPGEDFSKRYLMRRRITITKQETNPNTYFSRVELREYRNNNKTKFSTETPNPKEGYIKKEVIGYLSGAQDNANMISIYECQDKNTKNYFLTKKDPSRLNWKSCEGSSDKLIRRVGYISTVKNDYSNTALYSCLDRSKNNYFVSLNKQCEGKSKKGMLGYMHKSVTPSFADPIEIEEENILE